MDHAAERRARLDRATLYLVCGPRPGGRAPGPFLDAVLGAGVDVVQLRDKAAGDAVLLAAAAAFRAACDRHGALFIVNDRPDLARAAGADGVHVGQDDGSIAAARAAAGPGLLVGRSTHTAAQVDAAHAQGADYLGVGPVHATPTKPGRPAVGLDLVAYAAAAATRPWFAIGGIDPGTAAAAAAAGARRVAVVRAIVDAPDPPAAVREIRSALGAGRMEAGVGAP